MKLPGHTSRYQLALASDGGEKISVVMMNPCEQQAIQLGLTEINSTATSIERCHGKVNLQNEAAHHSGTSTSYCYWSVAIIQRLREKVCLRQAYLARQLLRGRLLLSDWEHSKHGCNQLPQHMHASFHGRWWSKFMLLQCWQEWVLSLSADAEDWDFCLLMDTQVPWTQLRCWVKPSMPELPL